MRSKDLLQAQKKLGDEDRKIRAKAWGKARGFCLLWSTSLWNGPCLEYIIGRMEHQERRIIDI
jgi:hypothetical protein